MAARGWGRAGWVLVAVALAGIAAYMIIVGWSHATAIATVGAFFLGVIGLMLAMADRRSRGLQDRGDVTMRMHKVDAGRSVKQEASVLPGDSASQDMARVTARSGNVRQRARVTNWRVPGVRRRGDRDG